MSDRYVIGIDGGGSTVRAAVVTPDLAITGQATGPTANPSVIGHEAAADVIREAVRAALESANLDPSQVATVGIGVAGASDAHSAGWLREVVTEAIPAARVVASADYEIALVGAFGERRGVLVLAGTGSFAYGVNAAGESALAGGWGYLLGDEGSGYWIGLAGLRAAARDGDGRGAATSLTRALSNELGLSRPRDLVSWLYHADTPPAQRVAALAPLVLAQAEAGDAVAGEIVDGAAAELAEAVQAVRRRLDMPQAPVAFAGGLLSAPNPLSERLCALLDLPALPQPKHPPVIGAAILALLTLDEK